MAPSLGVNLRVTGHCNQGGRKYMEDIFSVAYQQTDDEKDLEYAFFGIFDGHGGREAAQFAKVNFTFRRVSLNLKIACEHLQKVLFQVGANLETNRDQKCFQRQIFFSFCHQRTIGPRKGKFELG